MRTGLEVPSGDVSVTAPCAACDGPVPAGRTRQYCSPACRQDAYRRRHQPARPSANLPARRSRRDGTVYACGSCESRYLGEQWCPDCNRPCQRLGAGGTCPNCEEVILSEELTGDQVDDTPSKNLPLQDSPSTLKKSPRFQGKLTGDGAERGVMAGHPCIWLCAVLAAGGEHRRGFSERLSELPVVRLGSWGCPGGLRSAPDRAETLPHAPQPAW